MHILQIFTRGSFEIKKITLKRNFKQRKMCKLIEFVLKIVKIKQSFKQSISQDRIRNFDPQVISEAY